MNARMACISILVGVFMTGCSGAGFHWVKDGSSYEQTESDRFDCKQKVYTMYGGYTNMDIGHHIIAKGDMEQCMRVKGYRMQTYTEGGSFGEVK